MFRALIIAAVLVAILATPVLAGGWATSLGFQVVTWGDYEARYTSKADGKTIVTVTPAATLVWTDSKSWSQNGILRPGETIRLDGASEYRICQSIDGGNVGLCAIVR